ncbi:MAG: hypothetical protein FWC64_01340 [Treponema sp.]|nr:hypothetical protein [Treponema sp.]
MKRLPFIFLLLGAMLLASCFSFPHYLTVASDPSDPLQGTWVAMSSNRIVLTIEGSTAILYSNTSDIVPQWREVGVFTVEARDSALFIHTWPASISDDLLTVGNIVYQRFTR